jgi:hypothetical protein
MKGAKTGGRQAGTPNKVSHEVRELIVSLSEKYLASDLESLEPRDRAVILTRLLSYVVPRPASEPPEPSYNLEPLVIVKTEYINEEHKALLCKVEDNGE